MELMQASQQWATRPDDQRFTSLDELLAHTKHQREISKGFATASRNIHAEPITDDPTRKSLVIVGPDGAPTVPTNYAFGQLANRLGAPAGYLRTLPADIAADALNYGIYKRPVEDVGVLLRQNGHIEAAAFTGPNYGRVWNSDIVQALSDRFGDGVNGQFTVPGEFGKKLDEVTKANTTLFASDRDMFVFLADEQHRIEVPNRRNGQPGEMARGFFVWNSEVGDKTLGIATFLFDYVCCNRIVWGAADVQEFTIRHTVSAPERFVEEVAPAIESYANKSTASITDAIEAARAARLEPDKVEEFLRGRFTKGQTQGIMSAHLAAEDRPIETLWDVAVGATQYAQGIKHQDDRVKIEKVAGKIMASASK